MVIISKVPVPKGEDINSLIQSHEPGILQELLSKRVVLTKVKPDLPIEKRKPKGKLDTSNPSLLSYEIPPLLFSLIGGVSMTSIERLRVTLKVERTGKGSSQNCLRHSFDLYNDDQLERYARKAADRLDVGSQEMRSGLQQLVNEVESYRLGQMNMRKGSRKVKLNEARKTRATDYLKAPYLLKRTNEDIAKTGVVGERINRLLMYLCFTSRLRETPLHVITMGGSGTGKTYLQERIGALIPEEDVMQCTASTENAFYYIKDGDLRHMLILIEDMDGADQSFYTLRELMSKKWVLKLVPIKDASGKTETAKLPVYGPISLATTTTRERLYEDNANRCLLIYPDGSAEQQEAIMDQQRRASAGLVHEKEQEELRAFFKDMQRVLKPIKVRNSYAEQLRIPVECFKPLRTNAHYLHFIETVTFYHQYQRQVKQCKVTGEEYIETTLEDIEAANAMLKEVLLAKSDELVSRACRDFYEGLKEWLVKEDKSNFTAGGVRRGLRMAPRTVYRYLVELKQYGYVKEKGGNRYHGGLKYELGEGESYADLRESVGNVLDELLKKLKEETAKRERNECASVPQCAKAEMAQLRVCGSGS